MTIAIKKRSLMRAACVLPLAAGAAFAAAKPKERVIKVIAKKFEFVPGEIHAKKGETLVLHFTAPEVPMGASFPDFGVRTDVIPGKVATLRFTPDKTGSFTFACDIFCGSGHEDMSGTLIVSG